MQLHTDSEIEFELALGGLYRKERIEKLQHRVDKLERAKKNSAIARRQLVMALCDQMQWELRAAKLMGAA